MHVSWIALILLMDIAKLKHTHIQRPFFWDYLAEPVPER